MKQVPVCIIGGGISGLYCAYKLLQQKQTPKHILLLEKQKQFGGRMAMGVFEGQRVPKAAGIGRFNKDVLLKQLMTELGLPINKYSYRSKEFIFVTEYSNNIHFS